MEWFYRLNGKETGPISAGDLRLLYRAGTISADTPIRRSDMPDWRPLRHFVKAAVPSKSQPAASAAAPDKQAAAQCSECGRTFAAGDLVRFDDHRICADCRPRLVQKLRTGSLAQNVLVYAGFWPRFGAKFIDALILFVVNLAAGLLFFRAFGKLEITDLTPGGWWVLQGIFNIIGLLYTTFFLGCFGATPGKMAFGLKVAAPHGGAIGYLRAAGRQLAEYLSSMIFLLGYIMAAFDGEKRALHDRICHTRVVRR